MSEYKWVQYRSFLIRTICITLNRCADNWYQSIKTTSGQVGEYSYLPSQSEVFSLFIGLNGNKSRGLDKILSLTL